MFRYFYHISVIVRFLAIQFYAIFPIYIYSMHSNVQYLLFELSALIQHKK